MPPAFPPLMAVRPILITFPDSVNVPAKLAGLDHAMQLAQAWYFSTLGETFQLEKAVAWLSPVSWANYQPTTQDPNRCFNTAFQQLGWSNTVDGLFWAAFVDKSLESWFGFGGMGDATPDSLKGHMAGLVIKDGDCIKRWAVGWSDPKFQDNIGMLCHELGHLFGEGHENTESGIANIEYEWWEWPRVRWDATNYASMRAHDMIRKESYGVTLAPAPPPPVQGYTQAELDAAVAAARAAGESSGKTLQLARDTASLTGLLSLA